MAEGVFSIVQKPRVCIIGAGAAGLRAADVLLRHGAQVTLLEARDRVGGRIAQSSQAGHVIDLGPNWLQGNNEDAILKLAQETQTATYLLPERQMVLDENGDPLLGSEINELHETFWEIVNDAFQFSDEKNEFIEASESLMDFVRREAEHKFDEQPTREAIRKRDLLLQTADMWGAFVGNPIERQSLKFCWLEKSVESEESFVAGTFAKILARIAAPAVQGADLRYHQNVKHVVSRDDDQTVTVMVEGKPPEDFDEVIVTVPLGCLKADEPGFIPPLPSRLRQAIDSIGYGCLDKVYISFPSAFWQQYTDENNTLPGFAYWLTPAYAVLTNPQQWTQVCVNLASLPSASAHPTLLFYMFGPCSQHIARIVSTTPFEELDETLFAFFKPYISRVPNYSVDNPDCKPSSILATAWANDKYAGCGSYSNFQIGLEEADKDIECMREGLPERHVWFAGEHTAPFSGLGTVTGAYLAGERVANRVIEKWYPNGK